MISGKCSVLLSYGRYAVASNYIRQQCVLFPWYSWLLSLLQYCVAVGWAWAEETMSVNKVRPSTGFPNSNGLVTGRASGA